MKNLYYSSTKCLIVQTRFSALLPQHCIFKLVDMNVEPLLDEHLEWAYLVCTGGMPMFLRDLQNGIRKGRYADSCDSKVRFDPVSGLYHDGGQFIRGCPYDW